jgi:hypothetical protein
MIAYFRIRGVQEEIEMHCSDIGGAISQGLRRFPSFDRKTRGSSAIRCRIAYTSFSTRKQKRRPKCEGRRRGSMQNPRQSLHTHRCHDEGSPSILAVGGQRFRLTGSGRWRLVRRDPRMSQVARFLVRLNK